MSVAGNSLVLVNVDEVSSLSGLFGLVLTASADKSSHSVKIQGDFVSFLDRIRVNNDRDSGANPSGNGIRISVLGPRSIRRSLLRPHLFFFITVMS